jgi:uncharacterized flavoprotein (TIGR03862 family)
LGQKHVAIIGAGPAGLAAAEVLSHNDTKVDIFDAMPSPARKFLWAGKSGLNITHAEEHTQFLTRFGTAQKRLEPALNAFTAKDIQAWADELGGETFVGSSLRVFPKKMKASPLLRAWLNRLDENGVELHLRHKLAGIDGKTVTFSTIDGDITKRFDAIIFALGGASYAKLGSTAQWVTLFEKLEIDIAPFLPANCGFNVKWSDYLIERYAGAPLKNVSLNACDGPVQGEFVISKYGIEGSLVYACSSALREQLRRDKTTYLHLDLLPNKSAAALAKSLERQNPKQSFSNRLRKATKLTGVKAALLRELAPEVNKMTPEQQAKTIKSLQIPIHSPRPIDEAISVAGGVKWGEIDANYMLKKAPGLFVAGEMIDWEAPTGGYLISACLATGRAAAKGALQYLDQ